MEQNENVSLFGLSIDQVSKAHLGEAARWAKFLAIVGFVICGLIVLGGVFFGSLISSLSSGYSSSPYGDGGMAAMGSGFGMVATVMYILFALLYFFPCLFLFRFAVKAKQAIATNEQHVMNASFQNLKAMFRFMGILMIIVLVIWGLGILTAIAGAASFQ